MAKTASMNIRMEPETKRCAEQLFSGFGITVADAINIFLHKAIMEGGLPFEVKQPRYNAETEAAMQEGRDIMSGKIQAKSYNSVQEMVDELEADGLDD
jgi:DNA-damage-inducible protein J